MMGVASFDDLAKDGKATIVGDSKILGQLFALMVPFTPNFEILPGTAPQATGNDAKASGSPALAPAESGE